MISNAQINYFVHIVDDYHGKYTIPTIEATVHSISSTRIYTIHIHPMSKNFYYF